MSIRPGAVTSAAVDPARIERDLVRIVRTRSVTGDEGAIKDVMAELMADAGLAVERIWPDPAAIRADPDWPGEEMARTALPIVIGLKFTDFDVTQVLLRWAGFDCGECLPPRRALTMRN